MCGMTAFLVDHCYFFRLSNDAYWTMTNMGSDLSQSTETKFDFEVEYKRILMLALKLRVKMTLVR